MRRLLPILLLVAALKALPSGGYELGALSRATPSGVSSFGEFAW